jgi:hypothetical protein
MSAHILWRGKDKFQIYMGEAFKEDDSNDCYQYSNCKKCLGVENYLYKFIDYPGVDPQFTTPLSMLVKGYIFYLTGFVTPNLEP